MKILAIVPTQDEFHYFLQACLEKSYQADTAFTGKLPVTHFPALGIAVACGGLGKTQFAVQTQHLIDLAHWDWVICAGAAGALVESISVGDVVVATETVEHDIRNKFGKPMLPRFGGAKTILEHCHQTLPASSAFKVHFGCVASGDEDVVESERRKALHLQTGALAVAWEGAGGARACQFSDVPYLEVRGVSDSANGKAALDYEKNLPLVMSNVARVVLSWVRNPL
ncbi:MAG: 5'-methylthioadenosine/S-adenosylhomocysteine nucleosidase [Verrucomicrobiia bacterium]